MIFDSNRKYIDFRKLWTLKGTKIIPCGNWREANKIIESSNYTNLKHILIHVGCNDLDSMSGESLFTTIKNTIEEIKIKIPHIKITLSEITPRMDEHDIEVKATNLLLSQ